MSNSDPGKLVNVQIANGEPESFDKYHDDPGTLENFLMAIMTLEHLTKVLIEE